MTPDYATMESGYEMDRAVHKMLHRGSERIDVPAYSSTISDAWIVACWLTERYEVALTSYSPGWLFEVVSRETCRVVVQSLSDTAPLAICRAALLAVGKEQK
jgi:hypothetical protein